MAKFAAKVELQNAVEADYLQLRSELELAFFKEEKNTAKSQSYVNERGVFSREGKITLQDVNQAISKAASKIGKKYSFFVLKSKSLISVN